MNCSEEYHQERWFQSIGTVGIIKEFFCLHTVQDKFSEVHVLPEPDFQERLGR